MRRKPRSHDCCATIVLNVPGVMSVTQCLISDTMPHNYCIVTGALLFDGVPVVVLLFASLMEAL